MTATTAIAVPESKTIDRCQSDPPEPLVIDRSLLTACDLRPTGANAVPISRGDFCSKRRTVARSERKSRVFCGGYPRGMGRLGLLVRDGLSHVY